MRYLSVMMGAALAISLAMPASPQKLGKGGTGVDESADLPQCAQPLGTVSLVEDRSVAGPEDNLPPGMKALVQLAERQRGGGLTKVDPLPVLKLLAARSRCFQVVERGEAFDAFQRERELAASGSVAGGSAFNQATLKAADYLLSAQILYSDGNSSGAGGEGEEASDRRWG